MVFIPLLSFASFHLFQEELSHFPEYYQEAFVGL